MELFRSQPALAVELLAEQLQFEVPAHERVEWFPDALYERVPEKFRADVALVLRTKQNEPVLGVMVEVQLDPSEDTQWIWPAILNIAWGRLNEWAQSMCPTVLLVVSPKAAVAAWCARPIETGHPGFTLRPLVLGPDQVPVVTDPDLARRHPEQAMLSAIVHCEHPQRDQVFRSLLTALDNHDHATRYIDLILTALPAAPRAQLEALMTTA